jgi:hypothetical protein
MRLLSVLVAVQPALLPDLWLSSMRVIVRRLTDVDVLQVISDSLSLSQSLGSSVTSRRAPRGSGVGEEVLWYSVVIDDVDVRGLVRVPSELRHARALRSNLILFHGHLLLLLLKSKENLLLVLLNLVHERCGGIVVVVSFAALGDHYGRLRLVEAL